MICLFQRVEFALTTQLLVGCFLCDRDLPLGDFYVGAGPEPIVFKCCLTDLKMIWRASGRNVTVASIDAYPQTLTSLWRNPQFVVRQPKEAGSHHDSLARALRGHGKTILVVSLR
jgi:hypothetical protein